MIDPTKTIEKGMDLADDVHFSGEEEGSIISARHQVDMTADNWWSKSIRPMTLGLLLVLFIMFSFMSANGINISETLLTMLRTWVDLAIMFYFGSRGIEKVAKTVRQSQVQERRGERQEMRLERKQARIIRREGKR